MGLGVVLECEEKNVTENEGWSKEGREGEIDQSGKGVGGADTQTALLRRMPWRSMKRGMMMLGWTERRVQQFLTGPGPHSAARERKEKRLNNRVHKSIKRSLYMLRAC